MAVQHHRRILADGIEHHGTFELRRDFADGPDALRFELLEMGVFAQSYGRNGDPEIDFRTA